MAVSLSGMVAGLLMGVPAHADSSGDEGCTPGYWKNHTENWLETEDLPIPTSTRLNGNWVGFETSRALAKDTLLDALRYKGGKGAAGAERILLRAAAASWLNAAHEGLGYPLHRYIKGGIIERVNAAIASGNRATMLALADELDATNNSGCPLN